MEELVQTLQLRVALDQRGGEGLQLGDGSLESPDLGLKALRWDSGGLLVKNRQRPGRCERTSILELCRGQQRTWQVLSSSARLACSACRAAFCSLNLTATSLSFWRCVKWSDSIAARSASSCSCLEKSAALSISLHAGRGTRRGPDGQPDTTAARAMRAARVPLLPQPPPPPPPGRLRSADALLQLGRKLVRVHDLVDAGPHEDGHGALPELQRGHGLFDVLDGVRHAHHQGRLGVAPQRLLQQPRELRVPEGDVRVGVVGGAGVDAHAQRREGEVDGLGLVLTLALCEAGRRCASDKVLCARLPRSDGASPPPSPEALFLSRSDPARSTRYSFPTFIVRTSVDARSCRARRFSTVMMTAACERELWALRRVKAYVRFRSPTCSSCMHSCRGGKGCVSHHVDMMPVKNTQLPALRALICMLLTATSCTPASTTWPRSSSRSCRLSLAGFRRSWICSQ